MWKVCASTTGWRDGYVEGVCFNDRMGDGYKMAVCFNDRMEGWLCGRCVIQWQDGGIAM